MTKSIAIAGLTLMVATAGHAADNKGGKQTNYIGRNQVITAAGFGATATAKNNTNSNGGTQTNYIGRNQVVTAAGFKVKATVCNNCND